MYQFFGLVWQDIGLVVLVKNFKILTGLPGWMNVNEKWNQWHDLVWLLVSTGREEETRLHIFKRHMGLTKRGSHGNGGLTVSELLVQQTDNFTVHDTSQFVTLIIPTTQILQTKVRNSGYDHRVCVTCAGHICFFSKKLSTFFLLHHKDPLQATKN